MWARRSCSEPIVKAVGAPLADPGPGSGSSSRVIQSEIQRDGVVFHPATDRPRTLEARAVGERTDVSHRSRKHILDRLPVEQGGRGMGAILQDLGDVGANGFLVGRILGRGIWALLPLNDGVGQQLTGRSA